MLQKYRENLLETYIDEAADAIIEQAPFCRDSVIVNIFNNDFIDLLQFMCKTLPAKYLHEFIQSVTPTIKEAFGDADQTRTTVNLDLARKIVKNSTTTETSEASIQPHLQVLEMYKIALTNNVENQQFREYLHTLMLEKWTSHVQPGALEQVIDNLNLIPSLWHINDQHEYTIERIQFIFHAFQSSTDPDLAFHEIVEKLAKTATKQQLIETLRYACNNNDIGTLKVILQHSSVPLLQEVKLMLRPEDLETVENASRTVISSRIAEHYVVDTLSIDDMLSERILTLPHTELSTALYKFCSSNPSNDDILKLYKHILLNSKHLINALLSYSLTTHLEYIYDALVLISLIESNDNSDTKAILGHDDAIQLGKMIYSEVAYRIDGGMSVPIYASDIANATQIWHKRFAYFHLVYSNIIEQSVSIAITKLRQ